MASTPHICHLTSCKALDMDLQNPEEEEEEDSFWLSKMLEINVKATFNVYAPKIKEGGKKTAVLTESSACRKLVQEESHKFPLEQLIDSKVIEDWSDTNIWDVFDSMRIPIQRSGIEQIVGCALAMAGMECYKNNNVLRMVVEVETWVDYEFMEFLVDCEEEDDGDVYSINFEADDFWETVEAFQKLRNVEVKEGGGGAENELCSICLAEFVVGSEISCTPCSHVFHHRCIRAWLKKCSQKFCPNCVSILA